MKYNASLCLRIGAHFFDKKNEKENLKMQVLTFYGRDKNLPPVSIIIDNIAMFTTHAKTLIFHTSNEKIHVVFSSEKACEAAYEFVLTAIVRYPSFSNLDFYEREESYYP